MWRLMSQFIARSNRAISEVGLVAMFALLNWGTLVAQTDAKSSSPVLHGYVQTRFTDDYRQLSGFSIRRAKLWIKEKAPVPGNWFYKVQGIFRYQNDGAYSLQDVFAEYRWRSLRIRAGQQTPDFSLQRSQPDYGITAIERGGVIDALIPAVETGARDIGVQSTLELPGQRGHISVGMFNGNGANKSGNEDRQFLFTHRLRYQLIHGDIDASAGYSLAYRRTGGLNFKKIFGDKNIFSGDDFRWGVEGQITAERWSIQGEYLEAHLENRSARGFYFLGNMNLAAHDQLLISFEKYDDLNPATDDHPWLILGANHLFAGDLARLMLDNRVQLDEADKNYQTTIQLQLFFN